MSKPRALAVPALPLVCEQPFNPELPGSFTDPGHLPIPGGRGSRAAPGFNFTGVCGEQNFKCVISYVIYGDHSRYIIGAIRNAIVAKDVYPGWTTRFYYDEATVREEILQQLKVLGAELIPYSELNGIRGMTTRFLVGDDDTVDRYIVRDTDSRLSLREKAAVDEWIQSGYSIHILRDHAGHGLKMLGGMWGGVKGAVGNLSQILTSIQMDFVSYNADQNFLATYVYPQNEKDLIAHDSTLCEHYPNSVSFPTNRIGFEHVGQIYTASDEPMTSWGTIDSILQNLEAPCKCRRRVEWTRG